MTGEAPVGQPLPMKTRRVATARSMGSVPAQPDLGEVLEFMRLLWAVAQGLNTASKGMEASVGVTDLQRLVLQLVGQSPGITATRLARVLHVHPSTLTGVVKRLVKRGYLVRQDDPGDMRRALLFVTGPGSALDIPATGTVEAATQRLLLRMPAESLMEARELLTALSEELHRAEAPTCER
jgi:DNA-binding MarR family transcriptional regulator